MPELQAVGITVERVEGLTAECFSQSFQRDTDGICDVWEAAERTLYHWSHTAPLPDNGYHKCDVVITFEDRSQLRVCTGIQRSRSVNLRNVVNEKLEPLRDMAGNPVYIHLKGRDGCPNNAG